MKKKSSSMKTPKWAFIALFTLFCCSFGNTVMAQTTKTLTAVDGTQNWATGTWTNGLPSTTTNNTNFTSISSVANSKVDNTYYQRRLNNVAGITTNATLSTSNSGTIVIDVNEDLYFNSGTIPRGITNQSTTGKRFKIDCNVTIANSVATSANRHTALRCQDNAANVLEFGSNSVLDIQGNGPAALHPVLGTIEMNGKIKGNNPLYIGGAAGLYPVTFGATSDNVDFNTANCNMFVVANANLIVNTAANGTFFKNTLGKLTISGATPSTTTINSANVWNSPLSIGTTTASGVANLILNADQTANTGAVEMTTATAILNLTVAAGKSVTFGKSAANTWEVGSVFNIYGFDTATSIKFGNDNTGLTATQLGQIVIKDGAHIGEAVALDSTGKLVITTATWTGATNPYWANTGNWSPAVIPDIYSNVIIPSAPANQPYMGPTLNVSINSLTIDSGASLNVAALSLTITGAITNNGTMTLGNNSNLIQGGTTNTNTGNITVNRNSNLLKRLDYTIWSSPVTNANQFLKTFSPLTLDNRFYNYNEGTNLYNAITTPNLPAATEFEKATGYLIRMPNEDPSNLGTASAYYLGNTAITYNGEFTGVPNNGTITKAMAFTVDGYNMIGNPYPSTLDANAFITANTANIESNLYFWRKINGAPGSAYAVYNPLGGTSTTATPTSAMPNGTIQVGQGFFVKAKSASNVTFTNAMRLGTSTTQFFKTRQVVEKDRLWLNLTNTGGVFSQALVGYITDATQGVDIYDGKYINDSPVALTSNINNEEYTIQGRPTFDPSDVVALNFKTDVAADYTIALDHFDGLFATGQDVYLLDNTTGTETDLKVAPYTFTAVAGTDNARFYLKYQKTLKVDAAAFNENSVRIYRNNGTLYVNSVAVTISNIKVFDIQGRLLAEQKNVKASTATINNLRAINQVLIVKITGENKNVVTKKVVN